ncbi:MAG: amino acid permease [Rhodospirillaceae bacterium]|nr:amino acid permease [Rhodospirillaceae bacterium]MBT6535141.1 amino acid permease [Rhodospirillaceae bacterium]
MTPQLKRVLTLPLLTLYGVGTTVGAGIYVLTGTVIEVAGAFAPLSFLAAACLAGLSAASFAELSARMPRAAGEALYVREGLRLPRLSVVVGLLVAASGVISSAVLTKGFAGYLGVVLDWPSPLFTAILLMALVLLAIWGIREAVMVAAVITAVEVAGLVLVIWVARDGLTEIGPWADRIRHDAGGPAWGLIASGAVLAFFAFIGFEDMVNVAEEVRDVRRTMPRAILLTLLITVFLYCVVSLVALLSASAEQLGQSDAPLADIYARATGGSPLPIVFVGTLAIVNGALIQIIMGSRVLYGLAAQGQIAGVFAKLHPTRQTPVVATIVVGGLVALLALLFPLETLARLTSVIVLSVFALVNFSLVALKRRGDRADPSTFQVPVWVPLGGGFASAGLVVFQLVAFVWDV